MNEGEQGDEEDGYFFGGDLWMAIYREWTGMEWESDGCSVVDRRDYLGGWGKGMDACVLEMT